MTNLTVKLEHARELVDKEVTARKKIEVERDKLSDHLTLLRQLVMDDKLVGSVDQVGTSFSFSQTDSWPSPRLPNRSSRCVAFVSAQCVP